MLQKTKAHKPVVSAPRKKNTTVYEAKRIKKVKFLIFINKILLDELYIIFNH